MNFAFDEDLGFCLDLNLNLDLDLGPDLTWTWTLGLTCTWTLTCTWSWTWPGPGPDMVLDFGLDLNLDLDPDLNLDLDLTLPGVGWSSWDELVSHNLTRSDLGQYREFWGITGIIIVDQRLQIPSSQNYKSHELGSMTCCLAIISFYIVLGDI